jgi:cysteine-rich repeat protein
MRRSTLLLLVAASTACDRGTLTVADEVVTDDPFDTDPAASDDGVPTETDAPSTDDVPETDDPPPADTGDSPVDTDPGVDTDGEPVDTDPPPPAPVCGDRTVDPGEVCDDGNPTNGDGCSSDCLRERFRIVIVSAQLSDRQPDGQPWDPGFFGTGADGEVLGTVAGQGRIDTDTRFDDTTPEWNAGFDVDVPGAETLTLVVRDNDFPFGGEDMETFTLTLPELNGYAALRSVDLTGTFVPRLTLQVTYR